MVPAGGTVEITEGPYCRPLCMFSDNFLVFAMAAFAAFSGNIAQVAVEEVHTTFIFTDQVELIDHPACKAFLPRSVPLHTTAGNYG